MKDRYVLSHTMLERALKSIPLGTQTFSKSTTQYPYGASPFYIERGKGSRVWDVDGNEYIDFVNALTAIVLGYNDVGVTAAVQEQLSKGTIFSLAHPIEMEVAEKIIDMVPCAEKVRFGKNGSDVTSAAVRLARAYTGKKHIAACGYHGWQDWYIGSTTKNLGVPEEVSKLTHHFSYNNISSLELLFDEYTNDIAAVILEPMNKTFPQNDFLQKVKDLAHKNGAILVFDEMITGFRFAPGGAQELFGVTPDIATFGKALANGYPLSAIAGRSEIMKLLEEVFFSFTFGGETLSLAAANVTLHKIKHQAVLSQIAERGTLLMTGIEKLRTKHGVKHIFGVSGHPSWSFLDINSVDGYTVYQIKTLLLQEMYKRGILTIGTHNMSYAHDEKDIEQLLHLYDTIFPFIKRAIENKVLENYLECEVLKPLFMVR